jgi:hypothetical protein
VCRRFCAALGQATRLDHARTLRFAVVIVDQKHGVPNVLNATGAIGLARPFVRGYQMSKVEVKVDPKLTT